MFLLTLADLANPDILISLLTLTFLEIVLGIDNVIFISIVANKLPAHQQAKARNWGLMLALVFRLALLFAITWIVQLTEPVISLSFLSDANGQPLGLSWRDLILIVGGLFLVGKSTLEIHHKLEKAEQKSAGQQLAYATMGAVLTQIVLVDLVFSFDSILTAIGLVKDVGVMVIAVIASMVVMLAFAGPISRFINRQPTLQVLALAFLILIGIMLISEGFHHKFSKSYVYVAMAFSLAVEFVNIRLRKNHSNVELKQGPE
jgi:predicted tellurium resistance membrane protein TerC